MATRKKHSTTRLPQSIIDEINAQDGASNSGRKRASGFHSRKAERKAGRHLAKQRKAQFFAHGAPKQNSKRDTVTNTKDGPPPRKKVKFDLPIEITSPKPFKTNSTGQAYIGQHVTKTKKTARSEEREAGPPTTKKQEQRNAVPKVTKKQSRVEEEEDIYISMLGRKLGVRKDKKGKSKYGSGFEEDGFLDLLVDLDERILNGAGGDDFEDLPDESEDSDEQEASAPESESNASEEEETDPELKIEWTGFASEHSDGNGDGNEVNEVNEKSAATETNGENSGSKYVPPHLRKQVVVQQSNGSEVDAKLVRQLKGLLNRLSEQNIDSILKEIEGLYLSHRRHDITSTLTNLIIEGTCSHSILLDSYVALHAGLVACLHRIIGVELAAHFVQNVVSSFERHYIRSKEPDSLDIDEDSNAKTEDAVGKECSNLLALLSDLYNFRVVSCTLVYDIIRLVLEGDLSELDVELILKLARGSGAQLRQDDPSALKDIIQIVQSKLGDQPNASSRTRFMVETLVNLKNNKLKKATIGAQGGNESKERIDKFVAGIGKKYHVHAHEPLRISLNDLHQADSKGKWWLVGAAWGGDPLVEQQNLSLPATNPADNALLTLAKKQGMNTDVRRSVFIVLMSSDDYVDACDRLAQLNLTEVQQREIIRVLLHCCGNEKSYNPYYTLIAAHLCKQSHSHRVTLQYGFWDFLRNLGETNVGGGEIARDDRGEENAFELDHVSSTRTTNVARAYAWLVAKDCIAITILKPLDFLGLKTKTKAFLRQFFLDLFVNTQDPSPVPRLGSSIGGAILIRRHSNAVAEVLSKATRVPSLSLGILHFLSMTFPRMDTQDPTNAFIGWCCQISKDVLQDAQENR